MSSPFDETNDEAVSPTRRRVRRPWWRWNLITLAVAFFVLIWLRELFGFSLGVVWMLVMSIAFVWGLGPAFFVTTWINSMAERADAEEGLQLRPWAGNLPIVVLKITAVGLGLLSIVHLVVAVFGILTANGNALGSLGGANDFLSTLVRLPWVVVQPIMEFLAAATLFVLCEITLRLDKR